MLQVAPEAVQDVPQLEVLLDHLSPTEDVQLKGLQLQNNVQMVFTIIAWGTGLAQCAHFGPPCCPLS